MININDLGIKGIDTTTHDVVVGDTHITVKENLPVLEKMELIADIVNSSVDDNDFYNPCLGKINTLIKLVFAYTDIEEPEDMSNFDIYDIFSNGVFQAVMPIIANTPDYNFILFGIEEFTKNIYEYRNSARGILKGLMADAKESNLELEDIVKDINLAPESLAMVKDVLDKLG